MIENTKVPYFKNVPIHMLTDEIKAKIGSFSIYPREGERLVSAKVVGCLEDTYSHEKEEDANKVYYANKKIIMQKATSSIEFKKECHLDYVECRIKDLLDDTELIEGANSPSLATINYNSMNGVIGSDETGTGEIFKPMVVTAAYLKDQDETNKCIQLGVYDSKKIEKKVPYIARYMTEIKSWEDELIQQAVKNREVIVSDFLAIRIITNEELNEVCEKKSAGQNEITIDGAKHDLLKQAHKEVLEALHKKHPGAVVVVDDFMDSKKHAQDGSAYKKTLKESFENEKVYFTTKGDAKVVAVGLASDISFYLSNLGYEHAQEELRELTQNESLNLPKGSSNTKEVGALLANIKSKTLKERFMQKYCKRYYENVVKAMAMDSPDAGKVSQMEILKAEKTPAKGKKIYAVLEGRKTGKFYTYEECQAQVKGYSGAKFKSFTSEEEADKYLAGKSSSGNGMSADVLRRLVQEETED